MRLPIAMLAAALALTGCGSDGSGPGQEATQLAFTVEPGTGTAGQALSPPVQVSVLDAAANPVPGAGNAVTVSLGPNPGGATLSGAVTANAVSGVATFADLTQRELEVLELIAKGMDNADIAAYLVISPSTVRNHITSIFSKLEITNRAQAIVRARDAGLGRIPHP